MDIVTKFLIVCLLTAFVSGETDTKDDKIVSVKCLNCLCVAASGCNKNPYWDGNVCGSYRISFGYWLDAGRPKIGKQDDDTDDEKSFRDCANNQQCASRAVEAYMKRYKRDCDKNGKIDCDDFARIHLKGPNLCSGTWNSSFKQAYEKCMKI